MLSASNWTPWLNLNPELRQLGQSLLQQNPSQLASALAQVAGSNLNKLLAGIQRYQLHPYCRQMDEPDTVWSEGSTRLLDYGGNGPATFFVPSLINRAYILDLDRERSLLRWLRDQGFRPLLLDWGHPGPDEAAYTIDSYVGRLLRALHFTGQPLHLVGYCMGGTIALGAALRNRDAKISSLTLMATPWDFHSGNEAAALRSAALYKLWRPTCEPLGELPVDLIQTLFALHDPLGPQQKFMRFADYNDPAEIESFVALEDWLNTGIPLTLGVADTCLLDWYGENALARNLWVKPQELEIPAFVMVPEQDRIVPPESAEALAQALPMCMRRRVPLGHVGIIVSRNARQHSWESLAKWLRMNAG